MRTVSILGSILMVYVLLTSISPAQAQSWDKVHLAAGVSINDLCFLDDGLHGWAVGSAGAAGTLVPIVLHTDDAGSTWSSDIFPYPFTPQAICFVNQDRGWVACSSGRIYVSDDGGATWEAQTSGTNRKLSAISFVSETEGWITGGWQDGNSYLILHTFDGGTIWTNESFGSTCYSCDDVFFSDNLNGWICGYDNQIDGHIHHTEDGGATWIRQTNPAPDGQVASITFADNNVGWATTSSIYASPAGAILHTVDGGDTWSIQGYTNLDYNNAIDAQDARHVAITSYQVLSPTQQKLVTTTNGGTTWVSHTVPMLSYSNGIQYVNDRIRLTGDESRVLGTDDLGQTWEAEHHAPWWQSVGWRDALTGWAISVDFGGTNGTAWRTDDGGSSWDVDPSTPGGSQALFVDENHGWMLMSGSNAPIWRTTDGGASWDVHYIGSSAWTEMAFFINENRGWVCGSNGMIRRTDDGGQTWSAQSSGTGDFVAVIFFVNENEGWAAGGYGGGNGFIRHTIDGGDTWDYQTPASSGHHQTGFFLDNQIGWLVDYNGNVHHTTNGGVNWQIIGGVSHDYINELYMSDAKTGWLTTGNAANGGGDGLGFIYKTEDGGASWTLEWTTPWPLGWVGDISLQPGGPLWVCGAHSTLLVNHTLAEVPDPQGIAGLSDQLLLHAPQPNPVTASAQLSYVLPTPRKVRLTIYDVHGRLVKSLLNEQQAAGPHTQVWKGDGLAGRRVPAGVYFAKLQSGTRVQTRQILVR